MRAIILASLVVLPALLAGCSDSGEELGAQSVQAPGHILGAVVDTGGAPLAGAIVTIVGSNLTATTDAAGAFAFRVEAGEHVLTANATGHFSQTLRANPRPGLNATLSFRLKAIPLVTPRIDTAEAAGYLSCAAVVEDGTTSSDLACGQDDPNHKPAVQFGIDTRDGLEALVIEVAWEPGTRGADALRIEVRASPDPDAAIVGAVTGAGGRARLQLAPDSVGETLVVSAKAAGSMLDEEAGRDVGLAVQQSFAVYLSLFYHQGVPSGYSVLDE